MPALDPMFSPKDTDSQIKKVSRFVLISKCKKKLSVNQQTCHYSQNNIKKIGFPLLAIYSTNSPIVQVTQAAPAHCLHNIRTILEKNTILFDRE